MLHGIQFTGYDPEELIWRNMPYGPFSTPSDLGRLIEANSAAEDSRILVVKSRVEQDLIGLATYMNNSPTNLKIEIGGIWFTPAVQGTIFTKEALFLMIGHAFQIGYRRVEWKCDANNMKSRASAVSLGFTFEGIQQAHMIIKNRNRDTAWYRILAAEWPEIKSRILDHLERAKRRHAKLPFRSS